MRVATKIVMVLHKIFKKKKKAFGGYSVSFSKVQDVPLGKVFGTAPMGPSEMTKKLWKFVKGHKLGGKR